MAKLKSGTRIYGTATIDTSVVVGSAVTLSSSGVQVTGVVTATTFVGALTGTASSTTNIPNLTGAITSNNTTTSLGSFSSANLATALTDETGSGSAVFSTSPTLVTPVLGAATATSVVVGSAVTLSSSGIQVSGISTLNNANATQLTVSGVSTFTNGPILAGTATSTGTASQTLQVTGGAYVSGNLGIGTTNPTSKLQVVGDTRVSGIVTAFDFYNDAEYPNIRPTLDLAFAETKILDSRITFTRASTATYVNSVGILTTAAVNEARFDHNPTTGESLGLLVEEARTNVQLYSEQFDQWFNNTTLTVTANAGTSPSGTTTADKIIPSVVSSIHYVTDLTTRGSGTFTFSVYAKTSGYPRLGLRVYDGTAYQIRVTFDLSAGTVVLLESGTASITPVGNGWYRCSGTGTSASGNMGNTAGWVIEPLPATATVQGSFAGDGTSGALLWGAQVEAGAFPTSYIPTTSATVTRAADVASITGTNFSSWYNNAQGSFYGEWRIPTLNKNNVATAAGFGANGNNGLLRHPSGTNSVPKVKQAIGLTNFSVGNAASPVNQISAVDGAIGGAGANIFSPTYPDDLLIGYQAGNANYLNGTIARITYYPVRLPDAQLQTITL